MIGDTYPHPGQNLNGYPISLLALSEKTVSRLRTLNISTIEQLASIALLNPPALREEITNLIQEDIRKRLKLPSLTCYALSADSPHEQSRLIITSELFSFVACVEDRNTTSPTCSYWWSDPRWNGSIPFHSPEKTKRSHRRKKNHGINTDLQHELPLFDTATTTTNQNETIVAEETEPLFLPDETHLATDEALSTTTNQNETIAAEEVEPLFPPDETHLTTDEALSTTTNQNETIAAEETEPLFPPDETHLAADKTHSSSSPAETQSSAVSPVQTKPSQTKLPVQPVSAKNDSRNSCTINKRHKTRREESMPDLSNNQDSYDIWNDALIDYFTDNALSGERVFLSMDDDGITELKEQLDVQYEESVESFYQAVRKRVIINGKKVSIRSIRENNHEGKPECVAFLTAMVIAASRMVDEEEHSQTNYFIRLREVLGLPTDEGGRPPGMESGKEEQLWKTWANWLVRKGFLASAREGKNNYYKYTRYPLSQALLRRTDRDRLCRLFNEKGWSREWDAETLGNYIRREAENLPKHLHELLTDPARYQAVLDDMHELYEDWQNGEYNFQGIRRTTHRIHLSAGIYRTEDITGEIAYYLYPRSPRRQQVDEIHVSIAQQIVLFRRERQGWYMPAYCLSKEEIENGKTFDIMHPSNLETLSLPQQPFWILIPDPENPESGVYASWRRPQLGTYFIILCRQELVSQLEHLRDERLIEWSGKPYRCDVLTNWVEIRHCTIISPAWDSVETSNRELYEKLSPRENLNISLSGGLRVPRDRGWLEDYGPQITIYGFESEVEVVIKHARNEKIIFEETKPTNEPFDANWSRAGDYIVELPKAGLERPVTIRRWEELERFYPDTFEKTTVHDWSLCGTLIEE
jgi:hypothetical protein